MQLCCRSASALHTSPSRGELDVVASPLAPSLPLTGRVARSLERAGWGDALAPTPTPPRSVVGPPHKGEVWSLLQRLDQTRASIAATRMRMSHAHAKSSRRARTREA